jgi:hypothetical protein
MIIGGLVEIVLGIAAEGKSLEEIARPLSAVRMAAAKSASDLGRRLRT